MKVYTEVVWQWDDFSNEMVEISSTYENCNGDVALCAGEKGDDEIRERDEEMRQGAFQQLDVMKDEYSRMVGEDGYFAKKINLLEEETSINTQRAADEFNLIKKQATTTFNVGKATSTGNYQEHIANSKLAIQQAIKKSQLESVAARDNTAVDVYGMMTAEGGSGFSDVGERARIALSKKKTSNSDVIALGLKHAKEGTQQSMRAAEIKMNSDYTSGAVALNNTKETSENTMINTRQDAERKLVADKLEIEEAKAKALQNIITQGMDVKRATVNNFGSQYTKWEAHQNKGWWNHDEDGNPAYDPWSGVPTDTAWEDAFNPDGEE